MFPKGLEKRYCADFLDCGGSCKHGESCHFEHALFPGGFSKVDKISRSNMLMILKDLLSKTT